MRILAPPFWFLVGRIVAETADIRNPRSGQPYHIVIASEAKQSILALPHDGLLRLRSQ
jgi:hypothetical protein